MMQSTDLVNILPPNPIDFSATTTGIALSHFSPLTTSNYASNYSIFL